MVQWVGPFIIGIYAGILVDPWFRAWITQNQWARAAREAEVQAPPERRSVPPSADEETFDHRTVAVPSGAEVPGEPS